MSDPIPAVIVPPPPDVATLREQLGGGEIGEAGVPATEQELRGVIADLKAQLAGADQARAAAVLERDAARKALDTALEEPCTLCGKQRKDRE